MKKETKNNEVDFESINQMLDTKYGKEGTAEREQFNREAVLFYISEMLKDERKKQNLTQEQLAQRVGSKKRFISRIENANLDIQLSTLINIVEQGLGKRVRLSIY